MIDPLLSIIGDLDIESVLFAVFGVVILIFLLIDLGLFQKRSTKVSFRSALFQTIFWIVVSLSFALLIYYMDGHEQAFQFLTAYITEYSLSIDNIFVFIIIFRHFKIEERFHHKILYYGVFGAILFRAIFILAGNVLVSEFHWVLYIFGAILVYTGFKMLYREKESEFDPEDNWAYRQLQKRFRFVMDTADGKFFIKKDGKTYFSLIFLVVILIETTDIIFAFDSIPAVFSISQNPFIIYTSNIFAIMGLRAMFFLLEGVMDKFYLLQRGISFILMFIGTKMLMEIFHFKLPDGVSLAIIVIVLGGSIAISIINPQSVDK